MRIKAVMLAAFVGGCGAGLWSAQHQTVHAAASGGVRPVTGTMAVPVPPTAAAMSRQLAGTGSATAEQWQQYTADVAKSILDLQPFRRQQTGRGIVGGRQARVTLTNLNPTINTWYLLQITWPDGSEEPAFHLENPAPRLAQLELDSGYATGVLITSNGVARRCDVFSGETAAGTPLARARATHLAYASLCGGQLYLRNSVEGRRSTLEATVDFLRDRVWGGEEVIDVFHHLLADRYQETAPAGRSGWTDPAAAASAPEAALVDPQRAARPIIPRDLGVALRADGPVANGMLEGTWYAGAVDGTWVSVIQPDGIAPAVLVSDRAIVNPLDRVESASLCYLVAFDLARFDLDYELGTEHPRVNWSERAAPSVRPAGLPGPDGIDTIAPLIASGSIRPDLVATTVAAFTGGFKRAHGAFKYGPLALRNHASHYGFIEDGVVLSKLQDDLATVYALDDGTVGMKTWTAADNAMLGRIRHARQNGVPLITSAHAVAAAPGDTMPAWSVPGALVGNWSLGNWSGSEDNSLRTMRAGLALASGPGGRFLIYGVFSDATPSAMARVFSAYRVDYAMMLDMNALEHTYLAVYRDTAAGLQVDHALVGMAELDQQASGRTIPRFLGYSDNRDFFYLVRKAPRPSP